MSDETDVVEKPVPSWEEREISLLLERERKGGDSDGFDYIEGCAKSALKAFNALCDDGHSGLSIGITRSILNSLIDHRPLTPVTGDDSEWNECGTLGNSGYKTYQNSRYSALFKDVFDDGTVKYSDNNRFICVDPRNPYGAFSFHFVNSIVEQYPEVPKIEFPYMPPSEPIRIEVEDLISDSKNGDFDTIAILNVEWKDASRKRHAFSVSRYFDLSEDQPREIDKAEWDRRLPINDEIKEKRARERQAAMDEIKREGVEKGVLILSADDPRADQCPDGIG